MESTALENNLQPSEAIEYFSRGQSADLSKVGSYFCRSCSSGGEHTSKFGALSIKLVANRPFRICNPVDVKGPSKVKLRGAINAEGGHTKRRNFD
jgi:hypothetical protein